MATGRKMTAKLERRVKLYEGLKEEKKSAFKKPGSMNLNKQG